MLLALTLHRPWPYCFTLPPPRRPKRVENRTWAPPATLIDQWVGIHAGRKLDENAMYQLRAGGLELPDDGGPEGIVCVARYVGCVWGEPGDIKFPADKRGDIVRAAFEGQEDWYIGPFGLVFDKVVAIEPVPCRGMQKLWAVPPVPLELVRQRFGPAFKALEAA